MRTCTVVFILGVICFLLGSCAHTGGQSRAELMVQVDELGKRAEEAFLAGDVEAMLQYYCEDVVSMPNFHSMVRGKDDLRQQTEAILAMGMKFESLESTTLDVRSGGDYVYEIGTFRQAIVLPGGSEPIESAGKYVTIWKRQSDGALKIAVEIYNSDEAPPI